MESKEAKEFRLKMKAFRKGDRVMLNAGPVDETYEVVRVVSDGLVLKFSRGNRLSFPLSLPLSWVDKLL